jgi:hypothetical protein
VSKLAQLGADCAFACKLVDDVLRYVPQRRVVFGILLRREKSRREPASFHPLSTAWRLSASLERAGMTGHDAGTSAGVCDE